MLLVLAASVVGAAGCLSVDPPAGPPDAGSSLRLEDLRGCNFSYPDGSRVPCDNQATVLTVQGSPPDNGWICVENVGDDSRGFRVYQNLLSDEWGIQYHAPPISLPVSGVVLVGSGTSPRLYNWSGGPRSAFLPLQGVPPGGTQITLKVYHMGYSSDTPALQGGRLEQLWSLYDGKRWGIHQLDVGGARYYLMEVVQFGSYYHLADATYRGADFDLSLSYEKGFIGATEFRGGRPVPLLTPDCSP